MVETFKAQNSRKPISLQLDKSQKKFALPLWVKLQHSEPEQQFNVLLTLDKKPTLKEVQQLQEMGLFIDDLYLSQPEQLLVGIITKVELEHKLVHHDLVRYVDGRAC